MKTVRDACTLQPNALNIKLSDQIEQLVELINAAGDGAAFFDRTHITQGMQDLISEGLGTGRISSQAVFHLKQAMGGEKPTCWSVSACLPSMPRCAKKYCGGMRHASAFRSADIAAFNGRNNPDHFFWGEIANQLGKGNQFRAFWTGGPKAPDEKELKLFESDQPILIVLDEMPPYFHYLDTQKVGNGTVADIATGAFANLLTAAGKKSNVCVVVSDLAAAYDTGTRLINRALEDAPSGLGRQERNITPVDLAANEIYDILLKRLFTSLPDRAEIEDIAEAFGRKLEEAAKSKTANRGAEAIADEIAATYPFHPRLKNVVALFKENRGLARHRLEGVCGKLYFGWTGEESVREPGTCGGRCEAVKRPPGRSKDRLRQEEPETVRGIRPAEGSKSQSGDDPNAVDHVNASRHSGTPWIQCLPVRAAWWTIASTCPTAPWKQVPNCSIVSSHSEGCRPSRSKIGGQASSMAPRLPATTCRPVQSSSFRYSSTLTGRKPCRHGLTAGQVFLA